MKRMLVGALVGAIIIFAWQAVSRMVLQLHNESMKVAPNSEAILSAMSGIQEDGVYFLPDLNPNASEEEYKELQKRMEGKPYAIVQYNQSWEGNMTMALIRQFATMFLAIAIFIWLAGKNNVGFGSVFTKSIGAGFLIFVAAWYPQNIWYEYPWPALRAEMIDLLVGWALVGLWLGWWLSRKAPSRY